MNFVPSTRQDIDKYFRGSYMKFTEYGDMLFHVNYIDAHEIRGTTEEGREFRLYLKEDCPYEVNYILPHKSFFQWKDQAYLLQRLPHRQWHRGCTAQNTGIFYLNPENGLPLSTTLTFENLRAYVNKQKFFTLSQALASNNVSCALSKRMMFLCTNKTIYVDFIPVASVKTGNKIEMIRPLFKEEIVSLLKETLESDKFSIKE